MQFTCLPTHCVHQLPGLRQCPAAQLRPRHLVPFNSLRGQRKAFRTQQPSRRFWTATSAAAGDSVPSSQPQPTQVLTASQGQDEASQQPAGNQSQRLPPGPDQLGSPVPSSSSPDSATAAAAGTTIDNIDLLTGTTSTTTTSSSSSNSSSVPAEGSASPSQQEQQQSTGPAWASSIRAHFLGILAAIAGAWAAVTSKLGTFPAWVAAQKLKQLREAADEAPHDPERQAAYLAALNPKHPKDVLSRVENKQYATNSAVVVEYLKALVATNRLADYVGEGGKVAGDAVAAGPGVGAEGMSLAELLQELQRAAAGQQQKEQPGASVRRPLHVVLQGNAGRVLSRPAGPLAALWSLFGFVMLLLGLSCAWLLGNHVISQMSLGGRVAGGTSTTTMASSAAGAGAGSSNGLGGSPALDPKEYKKEELPEKSIKTFADVKGCDESKAELQEVVEFLKNPAKFTRLGAKLPTGVLLTGPPGTGKTLLAKAVAGEAGVPFFYRAGSEFEELYVGVGSRRMRALFAAAKKKAPCIVFIDEIDAIGGNRKHWENHTRKTLNQLLVEMDGFEANEGVIVMAATNLPETLDPALKRPGRFDRQVAVPLPDVRGRAEMLEYYLHDKPVAADVDPKLVARQTSGFSGADISNLVNEAALLAAKLNLEQISAKLIDAAYDKVLMGVERKSAVRSPESLKRTAYHESGHALVALSVPGASPIHKATIIPRGHALGMVTQVGREDEFSINRQQMLARILVALGGQVAEELVFGRDEVSSGATDDLRQATEMARYMVMQCGLSEAMGPYYVEDERNLSEDMKQQLDTEVRSMLVDARTRVKQILTERLADLHTLSRALLDHETLTASEISRVLSGETLMSPLAKMTPGTLAEPAQAGDAAAVSATSAAALEEQ